MGSSNSPLVVQPTLAVQRTAEPLRILESSTGFCLPDVSVLSPMQPLIRGHFDGLAPDAPELRGWCLDIDTVWLWAGAAPVAVPCRAPRPDLEVVGLPLHCGFVCELTQLGAPASLLGERLWASADADGRVPLPQARPWRLGALALQATDRQAVIAAGNRLLRQQQWAEACRHFAEALVHDSAHEPLHERLRYALLCHALEGSGT